MPSKKQRAKSRKQNSSSTSAAPSAQPAPSNLTTSRSAPRPFTAPPTPRPFTNPFANLSGAEAAVLLSSLQAHNAATATTASSLSPPLDPPPHPRRLARSSNTPLTSTARHKPKFSEFESELFRYGPNARHPIYLLRWLTIMYRAEVHLGIHWQKCWDESCFLTHIVLPMEASLCAQQQCSESGVEVEGEGEREGDTLIGTLDSWPNVILENWRFEAEGSANELLYAIPRFLLGSMEERGQVARDVRRKMREREKNSEGEGEGQRLMIGERKTWKRRHAVPVFQQLMHKGSECGRFLGWWRVKKFQCYGALYDSCLVKGVNLADEGKGVRGEEEDSQQEQAPEPEPEQESENLDKGQGKGKVGDDNGEGCPVPYWFNLAPLKPCSWRAGPGIIMLTFQEIGCRESLDIGLTKNVFEISDEVESQGGKGYTHEEWDGEEWSSEGEDWSEDCKCGGFAVGDGGEEGEGKGSTAVVDRDSEREKSMHVREVEWSVE